MRITYAVPRYLPHLGGIENHVAALAGGASRLGHQVTVLTQLEDDASPATETIDGVGIRRYPSFASLLGQGISPRLWQAAHRLGSATDVLHVHNLHAVTTPGLLAAARRGNVILTPHYLGSGDGVTSRSLHRIYDPAVRATLNKASAFICVSHAEAAELVQNFHVDEHLIRVIPNGVDQRLLQTAEPAVAPQPVVLAAGRLLAYKNHDLVVRALAGLPSEVTLVIAGVGPARAELEARAQQLGVAGQVRFVGQLDAVSMAGWYRRAAVVVSMSGRECFGMTLVEGFAAGCAVVASDIPAHREVVVSAGADRSLLLPVGASATVVAAAIGRALAAPAFAAQVTTWDAVVSQTIEVYDDIAARRSAVA